MRVALIALILVCTFAIGLRSGTADAATATDAATTAGGTQSSFVGIDINIDDDDDDDRVEVQLFVLGFVIGVVFVAGTGAYALRRKLGLTKYTPPADSGHH